MTIIEAQLGFFSATWWTSVAAIATTIGAAATIVYTFVTYQLFSKTKESIEDANKVAAFNTYIKIKDSLDSKEVSEMAAACGNKTIEISQVLEVKKDTGKVYFSKNDIKLKLLGSLEDMAKYERDGLIKFNDIDYAYGFYVLNVGNNDVIVKFINDLRVEYRFPDLFGGFEELYKKIRNNLTENEINNYRADFNI